MTQQWRVSIVTETAGNKRRGVGIERYYEDNPDEIIYYNAFTFTGSNRETFEAALEVIKEQSNGASVEVTSPMRIREIIKVQYPLVKFTFKKDVGGFAFILSTEALQGVENSEQLIYEEEIQ